MKRNIKIEIESAEFSCFLDLLGRASRMANLSGLDALPAMVVSEWLSGRVIRLMQTNIYAAKTNKTWPEKFSQAEATALFLRLGELRLPEESYHHLIRNRILDRLDRQLLANP